MFFFCILRPSIYFIYIGLASNFCGMYRDRRRVGLPTSRARARVRRLTPTDRYSRDSNPGPLDLKSSIVYLPAGGAPGHDERADNGVRLLQQRERLQGHVHRVQVGSGLTTTTA